MVQTIRISKTKVIGAQVGALCWRYDAGKLRILVITSRNTKRWILPKGWVMPGKSAGKAASIEAWEEAGVSGKVSRKPIGAFRYLKFGSGKTPDLPCQVDVYGIKVRDVASKWPEKHERKRRWMSPKRAASRVAEKELSHLIKTFDPKKL